MHELKLYEVQKKYKDKTAVKQVSYTFKHGVYGLLGENGAGKTTLMRLICGVLQPTTGNIYYDGMEIAQMGAEYRRLLGYLPQELGYYDNFTAERFLRYIAALKAMSAECSEQKIQELLELVELQKDKKKIVVIALLDTLEYLKRGGRISKAAAFAGGLLNIKPVISIADGEIQLLGKARGSKMGNNLLAQQIQKVGGIDFTKPVLLGYTGLSDVLLQKYIEDSSYLWNASLDAVRYVSIGSVIGAHAGPGAIAVAFFRK